MQTVLPYVEERARYLGDHPDCRAPADVCVEVAVDGIRVILLRPSGDRVLFSVPKSEIQSAEYTQERLGVEQAEIEENVLIGPDEWLTRHTVRVRVTDPEEVFQHGLVHRFAFQSEYGARVFHRRTCETLKLF
jgi:hypothetical protein